MVRYFKKCEICGLKGQRIDGIKRVFMAKFPLDEARCKKWVQVTGKEDLAYVPIEKLHQLKQVCERHFTPEDFKGKKTQLKITAVPSLLLSAEPLSDDVLKDFPYRIHSDKQSDVFEQHNYSTQYNKDYEDEASNFGLVISKLGTKNVSRESNVLATEHNYCGPASSGDSPSVAPLPSTSKDPQKLEILTNEIDLPVQVEDSEMPEAGCVLETEFSTEDLPPPEPEYSWQRSDTIVLADDDTDLTKACIDDSNEVENLSMYNDDDAHQLPLAANDEKGDSKTEEDNRIHLDYSCNLCNKTISGFRYTCVQCADFDLCAACEAGGAHAAHYVLRVPRPTAHGEVEAVLECIRKNLFGEKDDAALNTGAGISGDFLLDEIKSENEDTVLDENMSLPSMMERIEDDDDDEADPSFRETETRPSTAQSDSSSDESRARSELPVLRTRKRRFSDDPLRIDSAASGRGDDTSDARVLALQPVPDDIFQLHLQLDGTRRDTALTQRPTRSEPAGVKTYAVLTQTEHGRRIVKLRNIKVNVNRMTREDIDAAIHKDTAKR